MKSLFDTNTYDEVLQRLNNLKAQSQRNWGKMDVAQMLAHSTEAFKVPLSKKKIPRIFLGLLLGWMIKSKLYNDSPWKQNLPTGLIEAFHKAGPDGISKYPYPFFGKFTPDQCGKSMYKHLGHHFQQFGV